MIIDPTKKYGKHMPEEKPPPQKFTYECELCGFHYELENDSRPYLCLRCMKRIAKAVVRSVRTSGE